MPKLENKVINKLVKKGKRSYLPSSEVNNIVIKTKERMDEYYRKHPNINMPYRESARVRK